MDGSQREIDCDTVAGGKPGFSMSLTQCDDASPAAAAHADGIGRLRRVPKGLATGEVSTLGKPQPATRPAASALAEGAVAARVDLVDRSEPAGEVEWIRVTDCGGHGSDGLVCGVEQLPGPGHA